MFAYNISSIKCTSAVCMEQGQVEAILTSGILVAIGLKIVVIFKIRLLNWLFITVVILGLLVSWMFLPFCFFPSLVFLVSS